MYREIRPYANSIWDDNNNNNNIQRSCRFPEGSNIGSKGILMSGRVIVSHISVLVADQTAYIVLQVQKLRTYLQIRTTKAERFAVETHHFIIYSTTHTPQQRAYGTHT